MKKWVKNDIKNGNCLTKAQGAFSGGFRHAILQLCIDCCLDRGKTYGRNRTEDRRTGTDVC